MSQKVINLFGGPGTGKSETASGVFNLLKRNRIRTKYVQEFTLFARRKPRHSCRGTEAEEIDKMIKLYLVCNQIPFVEVVADDSAPGQIVEILLNQPNRSGAGQ